MQKTTRRILAAAIGALVLATIIAVIVRQAHGLPFTKVFSAREELISLWRGYKKESIEASTGRTFDPADGYVTTSEAESYTMLRAAWMNDKATFDASWKWTKDNLERPDKLMSWRFGKRPDGNYGVLSSQGGQNSASDADEDIALALVFGAARWNDQTDYGDAIVLIRAIWDSEVVMIGGRPYLAADNIEKTSSDRDIAINPSYFAPYAYRIFAKLDPGHPWMQLVDTSYEVLGSSMQEPLDKARSANIPPDWILVDRTTGQVLPPSGSGHASDMGFDALRVPFRLALDYQWSSEPRAKDLLQRMGFLDSTWKQEGYLYTSYGHDGSPGMRAQTPAFYGGTLGYFMVAAPDDAKAVYESELRPLFDSDRGDWTRPLGYYDANWAWFGIGLYNYLLSDLTRFK